MDYDRYDALLHWLFKQTQGDAWFRPHEEGISSGVAIRVSDSPVEFRIFPYENPTLEPFEMGVTALNPAVAIKIRSAAVHACLAEVPAQDTSVYVDSENRIQVLETMTHLATAEKEQRAAFIRDERVLVVWSDSLETIIPISSDFEERLIKLLWRNRIPGSSIASDMSPMGGSLSGHSIGASSTHVAPLSTRGIWGADVRTESETVVSEKPALPRTKVVRTWYGKQKEIPVNQGDLENLGPEKRPQKLWAPLYNGLAAGLSFVFIGNGVRILLEEFLLDPTYFRFILCATLPLLFCISLFFAIQLVQNVTMAIGPVAHFHENSKYYSATKPKPNKVIDNNLPHVTIQMPVYKESLESVLAPSIESLKIAMQTYARQGGTSSIFLNDDGLRLLSPADRDQRLTYYANHNIGWVARPKHDPAAGFTRAGRFKKASNMNYGLEVSRKAEKHLQTLLVNDHSGNRASLSQAQPGPGAGRYGLQYANHEGDDQSVAPNSRVLAGLGVTGASMDNGSHVWNVEEDLEEKALGMAIEEMYEESGRKFKPWAANARSMRMGEIILIVDSDTVVPEDCLRDAAREMMECENVAIIQHESEVMQVSHNFFENGIAYFTRRINRCISMAVANGEISPFMGHNAFLRWKAVQDASFIDPADGKNKIWSETNVSEDFDIALRLMLRGYIIRWATYSNGGFAEGVSLTVDDELNRWQKYAYGCSELLFNPLIQWFTRGPIAHQIHRFIWSPTDLHYKISVLAYMFSYYGIAAAMTIAIINYVLLGFAFPIDGFYMHSFEIWLATTIVFFGSGNIGYTLLEYRLGHKGLVSGFIENIKWIPFFFFFFGGLSIPVSQAILAHLFSYNITWSATVKEVERSNFFEEIPKIVKRFWFPLLVSIILVAGMIVLSTPLVPVDWQISGTESWAVIFPLAIQAGSHILFPIVLNPWLMVFSY